MYIQSVNIASTHYLSLLPHELAILRGPICWVSSSKCAGVQHYQNKNQSLSILVIESEEKKYYACVRERERKVSESMNVWHPERW